MAEPTTPNKGYTIPNTGDLSNAWGPVINENFTEIDTALAGSQSIALTSGGTVTMSSAQAQYLATNLTGTLTGNAVFALPAVGGFYLLNNASTGAYTVTCQVTGAPGATISLSAGWTVVYTDGTNVYSVAGSTVLGAPQGTVMLFQQTSAPTGWTKLTTNNDCALRIVSGTAGTGGSVAFSTAFSAANTVDGHALTTAELAVHSHANTLNDPGHVHGFGFTPNSGAGGTTVGTIGGGSNVNTGSSTTGITISNANVGSGSAHSHTLSNLAVKYVDVIAASRN